MSEYQKTNPTHGQKVSSGPVDEKAEYSGTVISDSLAADSIRTGGDFSKGNPTGISGTNAASSNLTDGADAEGVSVHLPSDSTSSAADDAREAEESFGGNSGSGTSLGSGGVGGGNQDTPRFTEDSTGEKRKGEYDSTDGPQPVEGFAEPGSAEDPGRLATEQFVQKNAEEAGMATGGLQGDSENQYEALGGETSS